jgi:hypothetical protein
MGSGGKSTAEQQSQPWGIQVPYLQQLYSQALGQSRQARSFYPESTVTGFSPETSLALRAQTERATQGSPLVRGAQDLTQRTMGGEFLSPESNPYIEATYDAAARGVGRQYQTNVVPSTSMAQYGRGGSGAEYNREGQGQDWLAQNLSELATGIYGGNYAQERAYQQQAASQAPGLADYDYQDIAQLGQVGQMREDLSSRELQDLMERYYFAEDEPRERLREYAGLVGAPVSTSRGRSKSVNVGILSS